VRAYKDRSRVEDAFKTLKNIDLQVRAIHHRLGALVKAQLFF
jgi:transposase